MYRKIANIKSFSLYRCRFTSKAALARFFSVPMMLAFTILLGDGIGVNAQSAPRSLRSDIQIRNIMTTLSASPSIRIAKDPRNNTLYYLKQNGEIYRVNLGSTSTLVYNSSDHAVSGTQGMAIGPNGTIYLVGNADIGNDLTRATIVKGAIHSGTGQRVWSILATSAGYPKSNTAFDHRFNGVTVSPSGNFIYVNSGSRTDHGEVQSANGPILILAK